MRPLPMPRHELADRYVKAVKELFDDEKDKYEMFHQFMNDFLNNRTGLVTACVRARELLKRHNNLLSLFSLFLQQGYCITLDKDAPCPEKTFRWDRERFRNEDHVYRSFPDIMVEHGMTLDTNEVHAKVSFLLKDHPDLFKEFESILLEA
ncbi:hypothetical protein F3Y22_tig00110059pilonHSYRG00202 [Hibiscus syriacus]|uniref:Uncharacterized protein n=1 Tax=Hibiscus syriacus TaxID=106335 RepID=A0A6A3BPY5_HIBSY|nr:hypothetical protein F3Y22_tig00110059pilonHSYRG00202 [Hibiscus syriacus]